MPDTTQQVISRVYALLRHPSQEELYFEDVRESLNDIIKGYVQDMNLEGRDQRTQVTEAQVIESDIDYLLTVADAPDFEAVKLEYSPPFLSNDERRWYEARLVAFDSWRHHFNADYVAACIYSDALVDEGARLKLNIPANMVAEADFRLSYRLPLLAELQMGERPPMPAQFFPLLQYDTALDCMSQVKNSTADWKDWVKETTPKYTARVTYWLGRWQAYLSQSTEPQEQPIRPYDQFRRTGAVRHTRGYLPRQ